MSDSTVYRIERQRHNGDWAEVGQIDSADLTYNYPDAVLEAWLARVPENAEAGRYRLIYRQFSATTLTEHMVSEKREWVVERVKDEEPAEVAPVA
jgi:hypothetical protein